MTDLFDIMEKQYCIVIYVKSKSESALPQLKLWSDSLTPPVGVEINDIYIDELYEENKNKQ